MSARAERHHLTPCDGVRCTLLRDLGLRSYMVVPMRTRERTLGAISFVAAESGRSFGADELALAEDLARRAAVAVENAQLYRQAQQAIRVRDDFLAAASHDLKNPLGSIRGNAQLLQRMLERTGAIPPQRLAASLANVIGSTDQMVSQVNELLDVARLRLGEPLPLERAPADLVALAGRAVAAHQASTERHHVELRAEVPELVGEWDAPRLERVLGNLLSNAIKFSPDGGDVRVTVRREGTEAVLDVRDGGVGIPKEDLERIFERFARGSNVAGRISGTGIGLATAKQIVEQHGGTIAVLSRESGRQVAGGAGGADEPGREGGGSTFTVRLPLATPPK